MTKLELIDEIMKSHIGKRNAITSASICRQLGLIEDDTHVGTRRLLTLYREQYNVPLIANHKGYYLAANQAEIEEYKQTLFERAEGILKVVDKLEAMSRKVV